MFALFFSLYMAMFKGSWTLFNNSQLLDSIRTPLNAIGELVTSIFNNVDTPMTNFGTQLSTMQHIGNEVYVMPWMSLVSFILALITSIGIVVMAVKGVKKAFGIFFGHIR